MSDLSAATLRHKSVADTAGRDADVRRSRPMRAIARQVSYTPSFFCRLDDDVVY